MRIHQNRHLGLAEHVDKARRGYQTLGIDNTLRPIVRKLANLSNAPAGDAYVA